MIEEVSEYLAKYRHNPLQFIVDVVGVEPTDQQAAGLLAVAAEGAKVSIRSGHGTGKTAMLAWLILWFLLTNYDAKVPCTAPTSHQLNDVLWAELFKWHNEMKPEFYRRLVYNSERIYLRGAEKLNFAVARTARKENPEALQGFHAKYLLFVVDEASGVDDSIFQVARGSLSSPGARVVLTSNPTRNTGYFYDSHHINRQFWTPLCFDGAKSPLVDKQFITEISEEFGIDSDFYRVRVSGDFPKAEPDQLIPLDLIEQAIHREQINLDGPIVWGLDPAYLGDCESALAIRQADVCKEVKAVRGYDNMELAGWVRQLYEDTPRELRPEKIIVDTIGYGAGVYDRLKELGYPVVGCNVGRASNPKYNSVRDELWWKYREWLSERGKVPDDAKLIGQSTAIKLLPPQSSGRIRVESKDQMRKRNIVSPDRADALCLTFYYRSQMQPARIDRYDRQGRKVKKDYGWAI